MKHHFDQYGLAALYEEMLKRGLTPGTRVRCALLREETFVVPDALTPTRDTIITARKVDKVHRTGTTYQNYGCLLAEGRWATPITTG